MNNKRIIYVEGRPIQKLEYKGLPVVTFKMVDELHQHPSGLSFKSFNEHKDELKINKDFFNVPYEEWSQIPGINKAHNAFTELGPLILLTKSGYLTIAKSFMDDSSWDIQLSLIKDYFISKKRYQQNEDEENSSIDGETAGLWMLIKELMHTLNSVQYDLTRVRHDLQNFSIPPNEDSQNLLKKTATLLSIVSDELANIRKERDLFRDRMFMIEDHFIFKRVSAKSPAPSSKDFISSKVNENEEKINQFISLWWKEYSDQSVGVCHLYPLIKKHKIPLSLGDGSERSQSIRLGRKLAALTDIQISDYIIKEIKPYRNVKRYKLQSVAK